jgi:hypothetical protein
MPRSRSIHGNAFSWPIARITSSAGRNSSPATRSAVMRPLRVDVVFHDVEQHALELAAFGDEGSSANG